MMSDKIRPHHLDRRAILYVRQSSSYQVLHNRESRALQYAMRDRLVALGWLEIEIIDRTGQPFSLSGPQRVRDLHEPEKSDSVVVAEKPTNNAEQSAAEPVEPRTETKGNAGQQSTGNGWTDPFANSRATPWGSE